MPDVRRSNIRDIMSSPSNRTARDRFKAWLLEGQSKPKKQTEVEGFYEESEAVQAQHHTHPWWKVMCLTGVDYFSTLGYQPGIAALAAGALSPIATLVLVLITLFGALPMYRRVAEESPHGDGSISMLERLLSYWPSKFLVLALIGFVATGFVITITLSAADAAAHVTENPFVHDFVKGAEVPITLALIALLGAVFLKGFNEAIGIAVVLVVTYIGLSLVVVGVGALQIFQNPQLVTNWTALLTTSYTSPLALIGAALLVFPRLALGLSGFETGVVVMPLVKGDSSDTEEKPTGRIRNGKKLLTSAALIMSVMLISSAFVTTVVIPPEAFQQGGEAYGRALAFVAHEYLGDAFGTVYDISTILILWFAGSSAMAGLLNIVPRYLPRYGMAPDWSRATRPLVLIFTAICFAVTIAFNASVSGQASAYATGVLALMTSAAVAVTLSAIQRRERNLSIGFGIISAIFIYTTVVTVIENPNGLGIAALFITLILVISLVSRTFRTTELRITRVELDDLARKFIEDEARGEIRIIANRRQRGDEAEYYDKELRQREDHHIEIQEPVVFFEVDVSDASNFSDVLRVRGFEMNGECGKFRILRASAPAVPNAIAAFLLYVRDTTGFIPHCYFTWSDGNPFKHIVRYVIFGEGDTAPVTREILRQVEPDAKRRPSIHVGG
jgi:hypothetical protein